MSCEKMGTRGIQGDEEYQEAVDSDTLDPKNKKEIFACCRCHRQRKRGRPWPPSAGQMKVRSRICREPARRRCAQICKDATHLNPNNSTQASFTDFILYGACADTIASACCVALRGNTCSCCRCTPCCCACSPKDPWKLSPSSIDAAIQGAPRPPATNQQNLGSPPRTAPCVPPRCALPVLSPHSALCSRFCLATL